MFKKFKFQLKTEKLHTWIFLAYKEYAIHQAKAANETKTKGNEKP